MPQRRSTDPDPLNQVLLLLSDPCEEEGPVASLETLLAANTSLEGGGSTAASPAATLVRRPSWGRARSTAGLPCMTERASCGQH